VKKLVPVALPLAALLLLAGCTSTTSATTATSAVDEDGLAAAKAAIAAFEANPTSIEITEPLSKKPESGKTIVQLKSTSPSSVTLADAETEAAEALGWTMITVDTDGTLEGNQQALQSAIDLAPDGITYSGIPSSTLTAQLAAAEEAGIPIVENSATDPAGGALVSTSSTEMFTSWGDLTAAYVTAESGGDAKILLVDIPAFPILTLYIDAFTDALSTYCPGCTTSYAPQEATDIGTNTPTSVVSELQKSPDTEWVVFSLGDLSLGVATAMASAGVTANIVGLTGAANNFASLADGTETMWTADSLPVVGWSTIDALARHFNGDPIETSDQSVRPTQLVTQDTVAGIVLDDTGAYVGVEDYREQYKALWLVG
jgi:ribose transport system substrate-binding protein